MNVLDRIASLFGRPIAAPPRAIAEVAATDMLDLPLRREAVAVRRESLSLGGMVDADDSEWTRVSTGAGKYRKRDLSPMAQDRMIEIAWVLWESNAFAKRLVTCMTDLIVGEGLNVEAKDPKIAEAADNVWNHPVNKIGDRARELHNALAVNGELILPVGINVVTGIPTIGFIDPYSVQTVEPRPDNVMVPEFVVLKKRAEQTEGQRLRIVSTNPVTGMLEGEVFYMAINKFPNSRRGRSDYLPIADYLDLFDQYMYSEVERVRLLSAFVYDLEVKDGQRTEIEQRIREIDNLKSGEVFGHNEKETLKAVSPSLGSGDRSDTARLMTIHIAGSLGMPIQWFGWPDSTNSTMQGQNDIAMKTPAARQKEFGGFLNQILRYGIERQRTLNPILFRNLESDEFGVTMPEISSKDISRVGQVISQVVSSMDAAMNNRTMSRRVATIVQLALVKHLGQGLNFTADEVMEAADEDAKERAEAGDDAMAAAAALVAARGRGPGGGTGNPRIPDRGQD